jgi:hypothetical protein
MRTFWQFRLDNEEFVATYKTIEEFRLQLEFLNMWYGSVNSQMKQYNFYKEIISGFDR